MTTEPDSLVFRGEQMTLGEGPKPVGVYWIGGVGTGVGFHLTKRPWWLHRWAMRVAFGWEWREFRNSQP